MVKYYSGLTTKKFCLSKGKTIYHGFKNTQPTTCAHLRWLLANTEKPSFFQLKKSKQSRSKFLKTLNHGTSIYLS